MPFKEVVVATGGGAVVRPENWGYLHHGIVVWLTGTPELLARRALRDGVAQRPMLAPIEGALQVCWLTLCTRFWPSLTDAEGQSLGV